MTQVTLDPMNVKEDALGNLDDGIELELTEAQKSAVVMTKYTSTVDQRADWQPEGIWHEQFVADVARAGARRARVQAPGISGNPEPLSADHGIYFDLHGTMSGVVGIMPGRSPMDEAELDSYLESNPNENIPLFNRWDFRVVRACKTNGPQARIDFLKGEDQKRKQAQTEMYDSFTGMFQNMMSMMAQGQLNLNADGKNSPSAQKVFEAGQQAIAETDGNYYDEPLPDASELPSGEEITVLDDDGTQASAGELQRR